MRECEVELSGEEAHMVSRELRVSLKLLPSKVPVSSAAAVSSPLMVTEGAVRAAGVHDHAVARVGRECHLADERLHHLAQLCDRDHIKVHLEVPVGDEVVDGARVAHEVVGRAIEAEEGGVAATCRASGPGPSG